MTDGENVTNNLIYATLQDVQERLTRMEKNIHSLSAKLSAMDSHLVRFW